MISIFDSQGNRLPLVYDPSGANHTLNSVTQVHAEDGMQGTEVRAIASSSAIDYVSEKLQWRDGIDVTGVTRSSRVIRINGVVHGTTRGDLMDRLEALANAYDPGRLAWLHSATGPFVPLRFSVPTTDIQFVTGLADSYVLAMPVEVPTAVIANPQARTARFALTLLCKDPRRYLWNEGSVTGSTGAGTLSNRGDYRTWPTVSFSMTGAGSATFTATCVGPVKGSRSLVLDLSGRSNGQAIVVDFDRRQVSVDGVDTPGIFVSGDWWDVEPGSNSVSFSNRTNVGPITTAFHPAYSL